MSNTPQRKILNKYSKTSTREEFLTTTHEEHTTPPPPRETTTNKEYKTTTHQPTPYFSSYITYILDTKYTHSLS
jgi:hypothetical protein